MLLLWELLGKFGFSIAPGDRLRKLYDDSKGDIGQFCCNFRKDPAFKKYHALSRAKMVELFRAAASLDFGEDARAISDAVRQRAPMPSDGLLQIIGLSWIDPEFVDQLKAVPMQPVPDGMAIPGICGGTLMHSAAELVNDYYGFDVGPDEIDALRSVYLTESQADIEALERGNPGKVKLGFVKHRAALHLHWSGEACDSALSCSGLSIVDGFSKDGFVRNTAKGDRGPAVVMDFKENGEVPPGGPFHYGAMGGEMAGAMAGQNSKKSSTLA
jgi:hypothetical protein